MYLFICQYCFYVSPYVALLLFPSHSRCYVVYQPRCVLGQMVLFWHSQFFHIPHSCLLRLTPTDLVAFSFSWYLWSSHSCIVTRYSVYIWLLFNLYKNLSFSTLLHHYWLRKTLGCCLKRLRTTAIDYSYFCWAKRTIFCPQSIFQACLLFPAILSLPFIDFLFWSICYVICKKIVNFTLAYPECHLLPLKRVPQSTFSPVKFAS